MMDPVLQPLRSVPALRADRIQIPSRPCHTGAGECPVFSVPRRVPLSEQRMVFERLYRGRQLSAAR